MQVEEMDFETAFAQLEETVRSLERGDMPLRELVGCYEEGMKLSAHCARLLDGAQLRISQIVQQADGAVKVVPFGLTDRAGEPAGDSGLQANL
ncbi:MAG: exodeoxyribonuclease VII small subunit [Chloroflexota bacterium]